MTTILFTNQDKYLTSLIKLMLVCGVWFAACLAQASTESNPIKEVEDIERIIVSGKFGDLAMQAFQSGNFALAEEKFKENEMCALEAEMSQRDFLENAQLQQSNQVPTSNSLTNPQSQDSFNASQTSTVDGANFTPSLIEISRNSQLRENTCENRGFQIYMKGLSQLQLGRPEEAETSFARAVKLDRNLYDAHYRIGLMKLMRQDKTGAKEQLSEIETLFKRCRKCDAKEKLLVRMNFLKQALRGKIKLH